MLYKFIYFILFASFVVSRHVPRYSELDEDDKHLVRAAYETPAYDHDEYQVDDDLPLGKLDLLKDGLWAIKAKIMELKAFNKALVANMLSTKLKVKELLASSIPLKKHHHMEVHKKKTSYNYNQAPSYPQYSTQSQTKYDSPQPQYNSPQPQYNSPQPQYNSPHPQYNSPQAQYNSPQQQYNSPQQQYNSPQQQYNSPQSQYGGGGGSAEYAEPQYGAAQHAHDPYYGH